jgi:hypothetical protein
VARIAQRFKEHGVALVGIYIQDSMADARAFTQRFGFTFPTAVDDDMTVAKLYRVSGTPTTVVLDPRQQVLERITGPMTEQVFAGKIQQHLCAGWARGAYDAVDGVKGRPPKKVGHWREELEAADRKCRAGDSKQARGIYGHVEEEVRRDVTKR